MRLLGGEGEEEEVEKRRRREEGERERKSEEERGEARSGGMREGECVSPFVGQRCDCDLCLFYNVVSV